MSRIWPRNGWKIFNYQNHGRLVGTPISTIPTWHSVPFCYCHRHDVGYSLRRCVHVDPMPNAPTAADIDRHVLVDSRRRRSYDVYGSWVACSDDRDCSTFRRRHSHIGLDLWQTQKKNQIFKNLVCESASIAWNGKELD